jgi:opacity protein-like surface antigen
MKKLLFVAALSVASTSVFAQAKNFEGFFVEGGLAVGSTNVKGSFSDDDGAGSFDNGGKDYLKGKVSLGYMKAINDKFLVGVSVGSILGSITVSEGSTTEGERELAKAKNNYSVALIPAYALTDKMVLRGKISYNKTKYESSGVGMTDRGTLYDFTQNAKFSGIGLGVGAQYYFTKNIYGAIDIEKVMYSSKSLNQSVNGVPYTDGTTSIKPNSTVGLISIGYKF